MTRARLGGVLLLLLSSGIFILWGASLERTALYGMIDFKAVYYGTHCLLQRCDPYQESELQSSYLAAGGESSPEFAQLRRSVTLWVYLPTAASFVALFAILPWGPAHVLWMMLMACCLILAAFLMWDLGARRAPGVSIFLACMVLANCEFVFAVGNSAGIVVSLCVIAAWCFLEERFAATGVLCLAVALAVKPHDAALVWLFPLSCGSHMLLPTGCRNYAPIYRRILRLEASATQEGLILMAACRIQSLTCKQSSAPFGMIRASTIWLPI
jgi:hypothetical protein